MTGFRSAHARGATWRECVAACAGRIGRPGAGLGFVYFTDSLVAYAAPIVDSLREQTGVADWIGTVGMGVIATGTEYLDESAISVMIAELPQGSFQVFSGRKALKKEGHFGVIHADPETPDVAGLISDMSAKVASGYLVGGLSSSRARSVQVANDVLSGGLSGAVLDSSVRISSRLTQGCAPLPGRHRVTACEQNLIATLDGRPALDVLKDVFKGKKINQNIFVAFPVAGSDRADYLVRNLIGLDPASGALAVGDMVEEGAEILFCTRDEASARQDLGRILDELRDEGAPPARGALYYSCVGRGEHLFGKRGAELAQVEKALGDVPLVGFFCNGEISHDRLYGYTGVLTLFH
jgi:small ligand-binding sensory domain FIST